MPHPEFERVVELVEKCIGKYEKTRPLEYDSDEFSFLCYRYSDLRPDPSKLGTNLDNIFQGSVPCTLGQYYSLNLQFAFLVDIYTAIFFKEHPRLWARRFNDNFLLEDSLQDRLELLSQLES